MQKIKGISVNQLAPIAVVFIVAVFAMAMGANILTDLAQNQCENQGYTWSNDACWSTYNTSDGCPAGATCVGWGDYAVNVTAQGLESMETFGQWLPTLALVVIAAVIIGVLVYYLGRTGG